MSIPDSDLIRQATPDDCAWLGLRLRQADLQEMRAVRPGCDPIKSLLDGLTGEDCKVFLSPDTGNVVGIFGVRECPQNTDMAAIWMMSSDELPKMALTLSRNVLPVLESYHQRWKILFNYIDTRNTLHIRWVKRLGFMMGNTVRLNGFLFQEIFRIHNHV